MPNFQNLVITHSAPTVYLISGQITHSQTNAVLYDFTGAKAHDFLTLFASLTQAQRDDIVQDAVVKMIQYKAGLL